MSLVVTHKIRRIKSERNKVSLFTLRYHDCCAFSSYLYSGLIYVYGIRAASIVHFALGTCVISAAIPNEFITSSSSGTIFNEMSCAITINRVIIIFSGLLLNRVCAPLSRMNNARRTFFHASKFNSKRFVECSRRLWRSLFVRSARLLKESDVYLKIMEVKFIKRVLSESYLLLFLKLE